MQIYMEGYGGKYELVCKSLNDKQILEIIAKIGDSKRFEFGALVKSYNQINFYESKFCRHRRCLEVGGLGITHKNSKINMVSPE